LLGKLLFFSGKQSDQKNLAQKFIFFFTPSKNKNRSDVGEMREKNK
jgi:hypothetical protein